MAKKPFNVDVALDRIAVAVEPYPKAALFELAEDGYDSPFEILVACILSIRTRDEISLPTAKRLFETARAPKDIAALDVDAIDALIHASSFHLAKAAQIRDIARRCDEEFGGELPCDFETMTSFRGVGPKCANLTLGIACGQDTGIGVDVHVHRVTNRWGYVAEKTPEKTMAALHAKLPRQHWVRINALLVPFGKHICTGTLPKCSTCPVLDMCNQIGVNKHR
jgi:endonuclease-3